MTDKQEVFDTLFHLDVNDRVEKKKAGSTQLSYLSWAWAWAEVKKRYPNAQYEIVKFENNQPYVYDEKTGYMVFTKVTIEGVTHEMWLPVMDGANKAMKSESYTYTTKYNGEKTVEAASMFDVNKTIMRCLVKNLAMFGLGLYIYSGEDLPEAEPPKIISNSQATVLNKLIETVATLADKTFDEFKSVVFKKQGFVGETEQLNVEQYGLILNYVNQLKGFYEKKEKEKTVEKPELTEKTEEPKVEQESILDRYGNPK